MKNIYNSKHLESKSLTNIKIKAQNLALKILIHQNHLNIKPLKFKVISREEIK